MDLATFTTCQENSLNKSPSRRQDFLRTQQAHSAESSIDEDSFEEELSLSEKITLLLSIPEDEESQKSWNFHALSLIDSSLFIPQADLLRHTFEQGRPLTTIRRRTRRLYHTFYQEEQSQPYFLDRQGILYTRKLKFRRSFTSKEGETIRDETFQFIPIDQWLNTHYHLLRKLALKELLLNAYRLWDRLDRQRKLQLVAIGGDASHAQLALDHTPISEQVDTLNILLCSQSSPDLSHSILEHAHHNPQDFFLHPDSLQWLLEHPNFHSHQGYSQLCRNIIESFQHEILEQVPRYHLRSHMRLASLLENPEQILGWLELDPTPSVRRILRWRLQQLEEKAPLLDQLNTLSSVDHRKAEHLLQHCSRNRSLPTHLRQRSRYLLQQLAQCPN